MLGTGVIQWNGVQGAGAHWSGTMNVCGGTLTMDFYCDNVRFDPPNFCLKLGGIVTGPNEECLSIEDPNFNCDPFSWTENFVGTCAGNSGTFDARVYE